MALGVYPAVALAAAREARDDARQLLASGNDPMGYRRPADFDDLHPSFLLSWGDDASLSIQADGQSVRLSRSRAVALRAFLAASED